jgi:hypothetical protein
MIRAGLVDGWHGVHCLQLLKGAQFYLPAELVATVPAPTTAETRHMRPREQLMLAENHATAPTTAQTQECSEGRHEAQPFESLAQVTPIAQTRQSRDAMLEIASKAAKLVEQHPLPARAVAQTRQANCCEGPELAQANGRSALDDEACHKAPASTEMCRDLDKGDASAFMMPGASRS